MNKLSFFFIVVISLSFLIPNVSGLIELTYVPQGSNNYCGPCSLVEVLNYYNANVTLDQVVNATYGTNGITLNKLLSYPRSLGYNATEYVGSIELIKEFINNNEPLIVPLKYPYYSHIIVIVGYSDDVICTLDSNRGQYNLSYTEFTEYWKFYNNFTVVISPIKVTTVVNETINSPIYSSTIEPLTTVISLTHLPTNTPSPTTNPTLSPKQSEKTLLIPTIEPTNTVNVYATRVVIVSYNNYYALSVIIITLMSLITLKYSIRHYLKEKRSE